MSVRAVWAFDLDGCLVGAVLADRLRPRARELLERLRTADVGIVLWSAGGGEYARHIAHRVGIAELIDGFYSKARGADGKWTLAGLPEHHCPTVCVDDEPEWIPASVRSIAVTPFLGGNAHDRGLERCFDAIASE